MTGVKRPAPAVSEKLALELFVLGINVGLDKHRISVSAAIKTEPFSIPLFIPKIVIR